MKRCIVPRIAIIRLAVIVLAAMSLQAEAHAQGENGYGVVFPSVGLAPGQRLRLTLFNSVEAPMQAQARIHHSGGILVAMGDGSVRSNAFETFDFDRDAIPLAGEAGTGRLQLRASFVINVAKVSKKIDGFAVSMDIIEISDGTSHTIFLAEVPVPGGGKNDFGQGDVGGALIGIVPGQTLRVTLLTPPAFESEPASAVGAAKPQSSNGHVKIFDNSGNVIAQSEELAIPPGEFRSFDVPRSALPVAGEPNTNRVQIRVRPFFPFSAQRLPRVMASYEIVDDAGRTQVLSGQECLVFFLGGIPGPR